MLSGRPLRATVLATLGSAVVVPAPQPALPCALRRASLAARFFSALLILRPWRFSRRPPPPPPLFGCGPGYGNETSMSGSSCSTKINTRGCHGDEDSGQHVWSPHTYPRGALMALVTHDHVENAATEHLVHDAGRERRHREFQNRFYFLELGPVLRCVRFLILHAKSDSLQHTPSPVSRGKSLPSHTQPRPYSHGHTATNTPPHACWHRDQGGSSRSW